MIGQLSFNYTKLTDVTCNKINKPYDEEIIMWRKLNFVIS